MSDHSPLLRQVISLSLLLFVASCSENEEPIQSAPLKPLPVDPDIQSVARQLTQVEAERRSLHQELGGGPQAIEQAPAATEEEMRQAGDIIRAHYQQIGRMPTRPEMVKLLTQKMPTVTSQKANIILDMMMLD